MNRLIDPAIADLQAEYACALRRDEVWTSRWVLACGWISVVKVTAWAAVGEGAHAIRHWSPEEVACLQQVSSTFVVATMFLTTLLATPLLYRYTPLTIYAIPSLVPLSTAWAGALAIAWSLTGERRSRKLTIAIVTAATAWSIAMFADNAWLAPESNLAFREAAFAALPRQGGVIRRPLARGDHEMSMSELRRQIALQPENARRFAFTYHSRWSLSAAPLILAGFALLVARSIKRRAAAVIIALGLCGAHFVTQPWSLDAMKGGYPVALAAWLPNLVVLDFCLLAAALAAVRRRTRLAPQ